jgi:hypothetical protein
MSIESLSRFMGPDEEGATGRFIAMEVQWVLNFMWEAEEIKVQGEIIEDVDEHADEKEENYNDEKEYEDRTEELGSEKNDKIR